MNLAFEFIGRIYTIHAISRIYVRPAVFTKRGLGIAEWQEESDPKSRNWAGALACVNWCRTKKCGFTFAGCEWGAARYHDTDASTTSEEWRSSVTSIVLYPRCRCEGKICRALFDVTVGSRRERSVVCR